MSKFDSLTAAFEDWFNKPLADLPEALRQRIEQEFAAMPWDSLSATRRRSVALQLDYQHDPATAEDQRFWWDFYQRMDAVKDQIAKWDTVSTPSAADLALKETRLAALNQELTRMKIQERTSVGEYRPEQKHNDEQEDGSAASPAPPIRYIAYPKAMHQLTTRLNATPEEFAAWVWMGPKNGGVAAYLNANELDPPPRFHYLTSFGTSGVEDFDYVAPLMGTWFKEPDIAIFNPTDRYITGAALIERWSNRPGLQPIAFIQAKIAESRLLDGHPIYGGTQGTYPNEASFPPLTSGLFLLSEVMQIELLDFAAEAETGDGKPSKPDVGSPEWRKQVARTAANALHDRPGGSRDKKTEIRKIWASGKYSTKDLCAEEEYAAIGMSYSAARKALNNAPEPGRC